MLIPIATTVLPLVRAMLRDLNMDPVESQLPVLGGIQYVDLNAGSMIEQAHIITRLKTISGAILLTQPIRPDEVPAPLPTLAALSPASAAHNTALTLTAQGSNFVYGCEISFAGKIRATTFIDGGNLSCALVKQDIAKAGTFPVFVITPRKNPSSTLLFTST